MARAESWFTIFGRIGVMPDQPGDHSEQIRSSVILFSVAIRKENSVPLSILIKNNQSTKSEILFVKKSSLGSFMGHGGGGVVLIGYVWGAGVLRFITNCSRHTA